MSLRKIAPLAGILLCGSPLLASAQKLDKDEKKWLESVAPLMLPDEEKTFKDLKDKQDRAEFQKIFWARRNPKDPTGTENPFKAEYEQTRNEVDAKFRVAGRAGSTTDCGRIYILLGAPDEVKKDTNPTGSPSFREPEIWTYFDKPGRTVKDGRAEVHFDGECRLPPDERMQTQLVRIAENRVTHPHIGYQKSKDGRLRLVDQLPKPTPVQVLLKEPRQDFPVTAQTSLFIRSPGGATYVAGLVQGNASGMTVDSASGKRTAQVTLGAHAVDEGGLPIVFPEREATVEVAEDGSFVASYGGALKPGKYSLKVAAYDPKTGKGAVGNETLQVPNLDGDELTMSPLLVLQDIQEGQTASPQDALASFAFGSTRLLPRFANTFKQSDSVVLLATIYNAKLDPATGKPSYTATFTILRDGKPVAKAPDQPYDAVDATPSVGPVPLSTYQPGRHVAQVKVRDNVAQKDYVQETPFEVK